MMAEISLLDLLTWETRLQLWRPKPTNPRPDGDASLAILGDERELTWAITARASMPMLPPLRGGELILLSHRVARESGVSIGALLEQFAAHGASGLIVDEVLASSLEMRNSSPVPILTAADTRISSEFETDINRMLTERRGEIYRIGMEIGRSLAAMSTSGGDLQSVLQALSQQLFVPITLIDLHGHALVVASPGGGGEGTPPEKCDSDAAGGAMRLVERTLASSMVLRVGPVAPDRHALTRMLADRIGEAIETTFGRSAGLLPSAAGRSTAFAGLLLPASERGVADRIMQSTALGLSASAQYRVALVGPGVSQAAISRVLAPIGRAHDAGAIDGAAAKIVEVDRADSFRSDSGRVRPAVTESVQSSPTTVAVGSDPSWIAVSQVVNGVVEIEAATRQARFIAALLQQALIRGPIVRFDVLAELGAYQLLYHLWGTSALRDFAGHVLGELTPRDKRGVLRRSLLAFLESGGSHVEAAARLRIHRNTLAYRLRQITIATGHDATDPERRLVLQLALLAQSLPPVPEDSQH